MKKFEKKLTASDETIKGTRAKLACDQAEAEQNKVVEEIKERKRAQEMIIADLEDLNADSTTSLKIREGYDAKTWVRKMQDAKVALVLINGELKVAQETLTEYFTE